MLDADLSIPIVVLAALAAAASTLPVSARAQDAGGAPACGDTAATFEAQRPACLRALRSSGSDSAFARALEGYLLSVVLGDLRDLPFARVRQDLLALRTEVGDPDRRAALSYWAARLLASQGGAMLPRAATREGEDRCAHLRSVVDTLERAERELEAVDRGRALSLAGSMPPKVGAVLDASGKLTRSHLSGARRLLEQQCASRDPS